MVNEKLNWGIICRLVKRHLYFGNHFDPFQIESHEDHNIAYFDLSRQIQLILCRHMEDIRRYRNELSGNNGDVLCNFDDKDDDNLNLHLHFSVDGGQMHSYSKLSMWPVHCTLLDLPLRLRSKRENMIILAIWEGRRKPEWKAFLGQYLSDSIIGKSVNI